MTKSTIFSGFFFALTAIWAPPQRYEPPRLSAPTNDAVVGTWLTQKQDAHVKIYKTGTTYTGRIEWIRDPIDPDTGKPWQDKYNPDKSKRYRPVQGLVILQGFVYNLDEARWEGGTVYEPESGNTYRGYMEVEGATTLKLRGFVGISLFGRTDTWTLVKR